jgi:hypothetical protein
MSCQTQTRALQLLLPRAAGSPHLHPRPHTHLRRTCRSCLACRISTRIHPTAQSRPRPRPRPPTCLPERRPRGTRSARARILAIAPRRLLRRRKAGTHAHPRGERDGIRAWTTQTRTLRRRRRTVPREDLRELREEKELLILPSREGARGEWQPRSGNDLRAVESRLPDPKDAVWARAFGWSADIGRI